jgi:hypothetical protein
MAPKEKAKELVDNFIPHSTGNSNINEAKQCALIAVDEILDIAYWEYMESMGEKEKEYWQQVKQEIINL